MRNVCDRARPKLTALLVAFALVLVGAVTGPVQAQAAGVQAASHAPKLIAGDTPSVVIQGKAIRNRHYDPSDMLRLNVGLAVHGSTELDALIRAASTPGSPVYGHYLTNAQYIARYAPTNAEVQSVSAWLASERLDVTGVSSDNLLVQVQAKANDAERAFNVTINDYTANGRTFHSNDRDPSVPGDLNVSWVSGLSDFDVNRTMVTNGGLDAGDFRTAYDVTGNGSGLTIGFTLWGRELPQSDFNGYATATGTTAIVIGQAGNDGLTWVQVDGSTTESDTDGEVALDTEVAHSVASSSHLNYWLGHDNSDSTLEDVLNAAANSTVPIISNSWGCNGCSIDGNMDTALQHGAATGKTFYFSSGDSGSNSGPSRPADSPYVVAVGGTNLKIDVNSKYVSETGWSGSGGGCTTAEARPFWQTGVAAASCTGRAIPDVAADSSTCAYVFVDGANSCFIGTSLSAPLWGAFSTIWNKNNAASGRPSLGFDAPLIYSLANDPTTYANDFHDITSGSNGAFSAGVGWDQVTGWGSPDFNRLSNNLADITYTGPTSAGHGDTITLSATLLDHNAATAVAGRAISFAAGLETCVATTNASGKASCPVTINDAPGHYSVIAVFAGDAAYKAVSVTLPFTVLHIPTTVTFNGAFSADFNDAVTLSATLTDNSNSLGIPNETLNFSVGAETCHGTTNGNGMASCPVTIADAPFGSPYTVKVTFAGDAPTYNASSTTSPFTVNREDTAVGYNGPLTTDYHDPVTLSATMIDPTDSLPIAGKSIEFSFGIDGCSATTTATGLAVCSVTPQSAAGTYPLIVTFAGDPFFAPSSDNTHSFVVMREESTTSYIGPLVILGSGHSVTLVGQLLEDGNPLIPIAGRTLTLSLGAQSCTGTTNSVGIATCSLVVIGPLGPELLQASFAGDAFYRPSADSKSAIVFAFLSSGAFVLGDNTVASAAPSTTVTWWADIWSSDNSLSGGAAPNAFKGFASSVVLPSGTPPTGCAGNWTSSPGNSSQPPSGVPTYMGVLVSSAVHKRGAKIRGNTVHIVVVKVDPGYAPNPGSHGTGTIVAVYC